MTKVFIDFDGVILDTWPLIYQTYVEKYNRNDIDERLIKPLIISLEWESILDNSNEINGALDDLKKLNTNFDVVIISKVNSLKEKEAKEKYLTKIGITNMIFLNYEDSKALAVNPVSQVLVDDELNNLFEWSRAGGKSFFFTKNKKSYDINGEKNSNFVQIERLSQIYDIINREDDRVMITDIVLTGILKSDNLYLVVKRSEEDNLFPGAWEFPGGHLESGETFTTGLKRELEEEIGFVDDVMNMKITNYYDEIKEKDDKMVHCVELDFVLNVDKDKVNVKLSNEHIDYKWVTKDSELLDDFIKRKLENIV